MPCFIASTGDGSQVWSYKEIMLDSLYRFKGQAAPAVILTDIEELESQERLQRLLYTGMSRAAVRLDLVCTQTAKRLTSWKIVNNSMS